jgi:predicted alpha/beta hydrolase family esterase
MAYVVQLHNGIYSETAVQYLRRISRGVLDRSKPVIIVAHQFTGDAIVAFNETLRQLNVRNFLIFTFM